MANDSWRNTCFSTQQKVIDRLDKLAVDLNYSRNKVINMLLEHALIALGEPVETTYTVEGVKSKLGSSISLSNIRRKIL